MALRSKARCAKATKFIPLRNSPPQRPLRGAHRAGEISNGIYRASFMKSYLSRFTRWGLLLFAFLVPIGTKKFLFDFPTPFRNYYTSEYTSAFLYASDVIFLICFLLLIFSRPLSQWREWLNESFKKFRAPLFFLALFLILGAASLFSASYFNFGAYSFGRLALCVLSALMIGAVLKSGIVRFKEILAAISIAAVFESIIGFLQFVLGKSVGLWFLGETIFDSRTSGIAKVSVNGLNFVRAYGTMPHANILAGFLVLALLSFFYLFIREEKRYWKTLQVAGIFIVLTGLFMTFSRSGWITAIVSTLFLIIWEFFSDKVRRGNIIYLISLLLVSCLLLFVILGWIVSPRASFSMNEGPVADRLSYDKIGTELIFSNPLGVGVGNELFYAYRNNFFAKYDVNSLGQWQPIHNLYLMISSETGVLGFISFATFIILLLIKSFDGKKLGGLSSESKTAIVMLLALLLFGLFDHFLWDLELGRLMLWVTIGILLGTA